MIIRNVLFLVVITCLPFSSGLSQSVVDTLSMVSDHTYISGGIVNGMVLDKLNQKALPYANIYVLNKYQGAISNEDGHFYLDISELDDSDTLRFQYIGYKTKTITVAELKNRSIVYLEEDIINLSETLIFGDAPDAKTIVKKVIENKEKNYKSTTSKSQVFVRERSMADVEKLNLDYKKSTIEQLDKKMVALVESKIPRQSASYTDFLGYLYFNANKDDSVTLKVEPIRAVSLKDKDVDDLEQLQSIFEKVLEDTGEDEYWKIKSGIFSQKIDLDEEGVDSIKDSMEENTRDLEYFRRGLKYRLEYSNLEDKDDWEFLHSTGKYEYSLQGGTRVNGEDVYIIDFVPKSGGVFEGRMYISTETYALVRADYGYAPGKLGRDFHLLGLGYTENMFRGSIYFEKKNDNYELKYFSKKGGVNGSLNRDVSLLKKEERWLFDKKTDELKFRFKISAKVEGSYEYLVLSEEEITNKQFSGFVQKKNMEMIYVDQFDDNLWKGYSIIEPTEKMREYKKHEID